MEQIVDIITTIVQVIIVGIVIFRLFRILRPFERGLIERFGKYNREASPGLNIVIPWVERLIIVDMREQVIDVPPQEVITKDNVNITVDAVIYYEPTDPKKLVYNVGDFITAATKLAQTNLRNVVGDLELDAALTSRENINTQLKLILDEATDKWGTRVVRVEIQRVDPPQDVQDAMNKVMKAERDRRAAVTEAEGEKKAAILTAEGQDSHKYYLHKVKQKLLKLLRMHKNMKKSQLLKVKQMLLNKSLMQFIKEIHQMI